jgi:hypothetical protein
MASNILTDLEALVEAVISAETTGTGTATIPDTTETGEVAGLKYVATESAKVVFTKAS